MGHHSIAETKNKLSELVDRARAGDSVIITRHGQPVAKITGLEPQPGRITEEDIAWLRARRVGRGRPSVDSGTLVSQMRDEDWR